MSWIKIFIKNENFAFFNELQNICENIDKNVWSLGDLGLYGGRTGIVIFYFYYSKLTGQELYYNKALELLACNLQSVEIDTDNDSFRENIISLYWAIMHLSDNELIEADLNSVFGGVEGILFNEMLNKVKAGNYDLFSGGIGISEIFVKSKKLPYLSRFVDELKKTAIKTDSGFIKWRSPLHSIIEAPSYNLGLAHGIPSVILNLSKIYNLGIKKTTSKKLIEGAIKYIFSQKLDGAIFKSTFPGVTADFLYSQESPLAWCYGDLGLGIALLQTAVNINNDDLKTEAIEILLLTTRRRDLKREGLDKICLCHGTAGISHIYNRAFQYTGIKEFKTEARYWMLETINLCRRERKDSCNITDISILKGYAGIGLSIISAISDIEPAWDNCLLLS